MQHKLKLLLQIRAIKLTLEIALILLVFFAIKTYMQRNLVEGTAPTLQGNLLNGQPVDLQSYRGKSVLVYFWATWCPMCKLQNSSIDSIQHHYKVITIAMNSGPGSEVKAYIDKHNLSYPVITDEHGSIAKRYGVSGVPTSFVIDANGDIAYTEMGYTTNWGLRFRLWLAEN